MNNLCADLELLHPTMSTSREIVAYQISQNVRSQLNYWVSSDEFSTNRESLITG